MSRPNYVVKGRFVAGVPDSLGGGGEEDTLYLGKAGRWCPVERAQKFASPSAGERALQETWCRLRNAGERSVILSIVKFPRSR